MPRRANVDPDVLLGRMLRLAERTIREMERRSRELRRLRKRGGEVSDVLEKELKADRLTMVSLGDWVRKVASDSAPADLSKLSDAEITRITKHLKGT